MAAEHRRPTLPSIREMLGDTLAPAQPPASKPRLGAPTFSLTDLHDSLGFDPHHQDVVVVHPRAQSSRGVSPPDSPESSISSHYSSSASEWTPPSSGSHMDPDGAYVKMTSLEAVDLSSFRLRAEPEPTASGHARSTAPERLSPSLLGLAQAAATAWAQQPSEPADPRRHTVDASARRRSNAGPPSAETRYRNRLLHHPDNSKPIQHARTASLPDFAPIPAAHPQSQHPLRSTPFPQAPHPDARGPSIPLAINVHPSPPSPTLETARPRTRVPALVDSASTLRIQPRSSLSAHELRRDTTEIIKYKDVNGKIATTASKASSGKYGCTFCPKRFNRPSSLKIHLNTHTGEKPYQCPVPGCGRHFSVMSNMRRHQRNSHNTDEIPSSGPQLPDMLSEESPEAGMDTDDELPSRPSTSGSYGSRFQYDRGSSGSNTTISTPPVSLHMPSSHFARLPHYEDGAHPLVSTGQRGLQRQHA